MGAAAESRWAAVVYNPVKIDVATLRPIVELAAVAEGWGETRWAETSVDDPGAGMTARLVADGASMVLAAGGDGTVRSVAESLAGTGVPLAILPSGTGNLLARNLDLALSDVATSVTHAFTGMTRNIDIGEVRIERLDGSIDTHGFLVMAGVGIDARIMASTNPALKKAVGWLAYVDAGLRAIPTAQPFRVRYRLTGKHEHSAHVSTVIVGNCGLLPGGIELLPDAAVDDGLLDIAVLQPKGIWGWLQVWRRVSWQNRALRKSSIGRQIITARQRGVQSKTITYLRSEGVLLSLDEPNEVELDGDDFGRSRSVRFSALPGALGVRIPAPGPSRVPVPLRRAV
jgi:diacylglycerol kinase family enzyme